MPDTRRGRGRFWFPTAKGVRALGYVVPEQVADTDAVICVSEVER